MPVELTNQPSPKQKRKSLLHDIGGGWYVEKLSPKLPPLKKEIMKNPKKRRIK